eukprot:gene53344-71309_t
MAMNTRNLLVAGAAVGSALFLSAIGGRAQAATPLAWSIAGGNVNACKVGLQCTGDNRRKIEEVFNYGYSENNSLALSDPHFGSVSVTTAPGVGQYALPELKAVATGAPNFNGELSRTLAFADGVQRFRWDGGEGIDLAVSTFVGSLHFSNTGFGYVHAALNIIDSTLDDSAENGDYWYNSNAFRLGGAGADCNSPGAIAISSTGTITASQGETNLTLTPGCGQSTFHLDPGEDFFVWARLDVQHYGFGITDGGSTFSVALSPDVAPDIAQALARSLTVIPSYIPGG